jgi:hypothetical protein
MESANDVVVVVCCSSSLAAVTFCLCRRRPFLLMFTNAATFAADDSVASRLSLGVMRCAYFSRSPLPPRDGTGERGVERHRTRDIYLRGFFQGNGIRDFQSPEAFDAIHNNYDSIYPKMTNAADR